MFSTLVGVKEGKRTYIANPCSPMPCIEAYKECSAAFTGILCDLGFGCIGSIEDSMMHSVFVCISIALDLVCSEPKGFDAFLESISPLSGTWHVSKLEFAS